MNSNMILAVITPETNIPAEAEAAHELCTRFAAYESCQLRLHIRKPGASLEDMLLYLQSLSPLARQHASAHSHIKACIEANCNGAHRNSRNTEEFSRCASMAAFTSFAAHSPGDIAANQGYTYYLLSPVFSSYSKSGYGPADKAQEAMLRCPAENSSSILALGGIDKERALLCGKLGFSGLASLGQIWSGMRQGNYKQAADNAEKLAEAFLKGRKDAAKL
jgi:thiamine-phosphate pyrophosphorylase